MLGDVAVLQPLGGQVRVSRQPEAVTGQFTNAAIVRLRTRATQNGRLLQRFLQRAVLGQCPLVIRVGHSQVAARPFPANGGSPPFTTLALDNGVSENPQQNLPLPWLSRADLQGWCGRRGGSAVCCAASIHEIVCLDGWGYKMVFVGRHVANGGSQKGFKPP